VRDIGGFTERNGVFIRLKTDGELYAVLRSAGVETHEEIIDTSTLNNFNVEKNNIYDIQFQWRSAGNYLFFIGDPVSGVSVLVHKIDLMGKQDAASIENPSLPAAAKATRFTEDTVIILPCFDITSENGRDPVEQYASAYAEDVSIPAGEKTPVIVIHNPLQINGETNTRDIELQRINVTSNKKASFKVYMSRDPDVIDAGRVLQRVSGASFVESDTPDMNPSAVRATTFDESKANFIMDLIVEANVPSKSDNPNTDKIDFEIVRGDYLIVTCESNAADVRAVVEWSEHT